MSAVTAPVLKGEVREQRGKEWAKKARREGVLPAIMYGAGIDSLALTLDAHQFKKVRQQALGESVLINLELSTGASERVFIKEIQRDPVTWDTLHVDFLRVDPTKPVHLTVRVRQVGTPAGIREGGMLERIRDQVEIAALPDKVPSHIDADVSALEVGQTYHIGDLPQFEGVSYLDDPDTALFNMLAKSQAAEEASSATAAPGEETPAPEAETK
ncbi:MAG: large subunit ribosomal protein [Candidatus Sumerlaeota bacterium]|nr:large subunit ribosomal protein [Candidatus Sumerlaeota bacterium]